MKLSKKHLRLVVLAVVVLLICGIFPFIFHYFMTLHYKPFTYIDIKKIPAKKVALVLGAGLKPNGKPDDILYDRIEAAANLYFSDKVEAIIVSGDNRFKNYNEPDAMANMLVSRGVPRMFIQEDFAGRRTYDSCWRVKNIFSQDEIIVVTQSFYMTRSLFLCNALGVKSVGLIADKNRYWKYDWMYWSLRDIVSFTKSLVDVYIFHPYVVKGEKIEIEDKSKKVEDAYKKRKELFAQLKWSKECEKYFDVDWSLDTEQDRTLFFADLVNVTTTKISDTLTLYTIPCFAPASNPFVTTYVLYDTSSKAPQALPVEFDTINMDKQPQIKDTLVGAGPFDIKTMELKAFAKEDASCHWEETYKLVGKEFFLKKYQTYGCQNHPVEKGEHGWHVIYENPSL